MTNQPWSQIVHFLKSFTLPKFNSEFTPEKWLEDDPFLLGFGNLSGADINHDLRNSMNSRAKNLRWARLDSHASSGNSRWHRLQRTPKSDGCDTSDCKVESRKVVTVTRKLRQDFYQAISSLKFDAFSYIDLAIENHHLSKQVSST